MPTAADRSNSAPNTGKPVVRPPGSTAAEHRSGERVWPARVPSAPAMRKTRASPAAIRAATASSARIGVSPPVGWIRGRVRGHVEPQRLGDERTEIVVRPRADRHQLDRVDLGEHATATVVVGRTRRRLDQAQRFGIAHVVVVPVGDLADPDDHRDRHAHEVAPPSSTRIAPDMYPASSDVM